MRWEEIEAGWKAMTRRVRADWPGADVDATRLDERTDKRSDAPRASIIPDATQVADRSDRSMR